MKIIIDRNECEGKASCLEVCPEDVFEMKKPDRKDLTLLSRIKMKFHGEKQAFAVRPENCTLCQLCVENCPEGAILTEA